MKKFTTVVSVGTPLDMPNVDTDQIIPKNFLKRVERTGFGQFLFNDWRFDASGKPVNTFVLNDSRYAGSEILLARDNFGCGSSREHAPWALLDYGFKVIIAPSYADIFYNNCFQNGILPVVTENKHLDELFAVCKKPVPEKITVDLEKKLISAGSLSINFNIAENLREKLLLGLDDIGFTLQFEKEILAYEKQFA